MNNTLTPGVILGAIALYFIALILISYFTGKKSGNLRFFLAGRQSPWLVVAFGMIGATLSGVTFISVPGTVGADGANTAFSYLQLVFGYLLGYLFIATILLPLYYRMNLTSIYGYLRERFGFFSYKIGAGYFLLSRTIGAAFRLFLVAIVLYEFVLGPFGFPFWATVITTIALIWLYTFRGGLNTIIWTDILQTFFMLLSVVLTIIAIGQALDLKPGGIVEAIRISPYSKVFYFEGGWSDPNNFFKQFLSGALITITMTGLDQDMMQKNLSCRSLRDAQKNMFTFSIILVFANLLFLSLGALLYIYAAQIGLAVPDQTDLLFPMVALQHLPAFVGIIFILGLIAAAYSSADSALTALTTSFCVDFLEFESKDRPAEEERRLRFWVHVGFSILLFFVIMLFRKINDQAVIQELFIWAGYTYGPLLGLFAFGLFTRLRIRDRYVLIVCLASPVLSFFINKYSEEFLYGFQFGFMIIALNGLLTFIGLLAISYREYEVEE